MDKRLLQHGVFSWCELMTTDVKAAKAFYSALFDWQMEEMPQDGTDYTILRAGSSEVGGLMQIPPDAEGCPPHWGTYVTVDDVNHTANLATSLGGKILVPPREVPGVGRFCVLQDPQGAVLAVITYANPR
jgi:predicted enzyme related to lactoylglutathione lyase